MQTFDQSLMHLVKSELVTFEEALKHVSNADDFALRFRGIASTSDGTWDEFDKDEDEAGRQPAPPESAAPATPAAAKLPDPAGGATKSPDDSLRIERF